jgi:dihydroflavonol-4-reductase
MVRQAERYLVTGATGLVGNNVVRKLLAAGHSVRVLTRPGGDPRPLAGLPVEIIPGDIRDRAAVELACDGVDIVIHAAGHVAIGWTEGALHRDINVQGTRHVAETARRAGARLVHVSSVNALGLGSLDAPADEEHALPGIVPVPYVVTKRAADELVREEVERGLWGVIVHPGTMFGPWDWRPSSGKMLLEVTRFCWWAPVGAASFCDARDVSEGAIRAAERGTSGRSYILAGHNMPFRTVWKQMAALVGKAGPRLPMGPIFRAIVAPACDVTTWLRRRETPANSAALALSRQSHCFSSERAERELGYTIRPLEETLADAWQWLQENGYVGKKVRTQQI